MADKWEKYSVPNTQVPQGEQNNSSQVGGQIASAGAMGVGALAVGGAAKWMTDPFVKRAILQHTQINPLRQKYNIDSNIQTSKIPQEIGKKITQASNFNKLGANQFKQILGNEESSVKSNLIKNTALNLSKNYPDWQKSGYEAYGNGLNNIENTLSKANISFEPDKFNQNVIQKTADTLNARGLTQEANNLTDYANRRSWGVNEEGAATGAPISFSDAKQAIVNLAKQNPSAARELRSNWGSHIEDVTQGTDVGSQMSAINEAYKPFKQADIVAYKFAGANPSILDTTKVTNALHNYYLGNKQSNPETTAFLKSLGNGTGGTTPIQGLSDQSDAIDAAIQKRTGMIAAQKLIENDNVNKITGYQNDQATAGTLANIEDGLEKQIGTRAKVAGWGAGLATVGGVAKGFMQSAPYGVIQNELMKRVMGVDPVTAIGAAMGDKNAQQQIQQAYQDRSLT